MNKILLLFLFFGISLYGNLRDVNIRLNDECNNNDFQSCLELGENGIFVHQMVDRIKEDKLMLSDENMTIEEKKKRDLLLETDIISPLTKACNAGKGGACVLLSRTYFNGTGGITKDIDNVIMYANLACAYGDGEGCALLAVANANKYPHSPLTSNLVLGNLEKSCEKKNAYGCYLAGKIAIEDNDDANKFKAVALLRKGCTDKNLIHSGDSKRDNCSLYGALLYDGNYVKKDTKSGLKFLSEGCRDGNGLACINSAKIYENLSESRNKIEKIKHLREARQYYGDACNLQEREGCIRGNQVDEILEKLK